LTHNNDVVKSARPYPRVRPLEGGKIMSDLHIRFQTMRLFMEVKSPVGSVQFTHSALKPPGFN
jgi:hypothetical protein